MESHKRKRSGGIEQLRETIEGAQHKIKLHGGRRIMGSRDLDDIMTEDAIREALLDEENDSNCRLSSIYIDDAVSNIRNGGAKVFALLVLVRCTNSLLEFINRDHFQRGIDEQLPLSRADLERMLPSSNEAEDFYSRQWQFAVPVFSESIFNKVYPIDYILPFTKDNRIGVGGFGVVYEIEIDSSYHNFQDGLQLVRKEFEPDEKMDQISSAYDGDDQLKIERNDNFEQELHNLLTLKPLKHPNIVQLLSAYTYGGKFNLIFPKAREGTLHDVLYGLRSKPPRLQFDHCFLAALAGLCSAVRAVHEYLPDPLNLDLIGCHHDLKPENVLIDGESFLLADLGLSRFKSVDETSSTYSKVKLAQYSPPESYRPRDQAETPIVRRSSDIWSLGCIVVEVIAYIRGGHEEVQELKDRRKHTDNHWTDFRFYCAGQMDPAVHKFLTEVQCSAPQSLRQLGFLAQEMLRIAEDQRPKARDVEARMRQIAILATHEPIDQLYTAICEKSKTLQSSIEFFKFCAWKHATLELQDGSDETVQWDENRSGDFDNVRTTMFQMHTELRSLQQEHEKPKFRMFRTLHQLNNRLHQQLSQPSQDRARTILELNILGSAEYSADFTNVGLPDQESLKLSLMKNVMKMLEANQGSSSIAHEITDLKSLVELSSLDDECLDDSIKIRVLEGVHFNSHERYIVERKRYPEDNFIEENIDELHGRLEMIVGKLRAAFEVEAENKFRVPKCLGWFRIPKSLTCGIIYGLPSSNLELITLRQALEQSCNGQEPNPPLESRFQLAHSLASSVLEFHKVSWLQRGIAPSNIAFFYPAGGSWLPEIIRPYSLGYISSRADKDNALTEGPSPNNYISNYQHPLYRKNNLRFNIEFDYYSLGVVLLEIGLWQPHATIARQQLDKPENFSANTVDDIIESCWQPLAFSMGSKYARIVEICLQLQFGQPSRSAAQDKLSYDTQLKQSFFRLVVEPLSRVSI